LKFKATYRHETNAPALLRVVLDSNPQGLDKPQTASDILLTAMQACEAKLHVRFLQGPGGLISFPWPNNFHVSDVWNPTHSELQILTDAGKDSFDQFKKAISKDKLRSWADFISIGVDGSSSATGQHIEFVFIYDTAADSVQITGKSYPTCQQERKLVRQPDLCSHILLLGLDSVLVLVCHDLNIFSNRAHLNSSAGSRRHALLEDARTLFSSHVPAFTVVLHHPHTCDTPKTWSIAWSGVFKSLPAVRLASGAGNWWNNDHLQRVSISSCLDATAQGLVSTVIISGH
jgi:hypothetical protein